MSELVAQVEAFLLAVAPRYSAESLRVHRTGLKKFMKFCHERKLEGARDINEQTLGVFECWLRFSPLAEATISIILRSAKSFLKWAYQNGLTFWDVSLFSLSAPISKTPQPPTVGMMMKLLKLPNTKKPLGLRDQFALELLYSLGLRLAECCRLNLKDLDLDNETLKVKGKGGDERLLPVSPHLKACAQRYLTKARPKLNPSSKEQALLLNLTGNRLSHQSLRILVRKYGAKLGLKISTHHLRHACATHLVEAGMELPQIQRLLGHRNINSTERYAQISSHQLARKFHQTTRGRR